MYLKILGEAMSREIVFKAIGLDGKRIQKKETWVVLFFFFFQRLREFQHFSQGRKNQSFGVI